MLPQAYPTEYTKPMEEELTQKGIKALNTPKQVEEMIKKPGKKLILINSVCGCAAGNARPAMLEINEGIESYTVFAGVDREATEKFRSYLDVPPSSPSFYVFENDKLVWYLPRNGIEGHKKEEIAENIKKAI